MTTQSVDAAKADAFVGRVLGDTSAMTTVILAAIGDRLGLFKALATGGPAAPADLAAQTGCQERYVREWLGGMASAAYLDYDPATNRFTLPPEHAPVLAQETGPVFFGGVHQELLGTLPTLPRVVQAFRRGGGVSADAFDGNLWEGIERFTAGWFDNLLLPVWLPAVPDVQAKLERGTTVADVGCGHGRALIKLAQAYPKARFTGYDVLASAVARATANAEAAGVADRVRFRPLDASKCLPEQYDVITTFDVVHDAVNPRGLLHTIRESLTPDGIYLCVEINCSERLEENAGPIGALFHGFSVLLCMTVSLAEGGAGLGTLGLPESTLRELCTQAGFSSMRRVPLENPFNVLYEIRP
jgi:2-polyprenyl-3-methyl-5-hydroxy-6-metoxy-1,4-benzoquinol methylase